MRIVWRVFGVVAALVITVGATDAGANGHALMFAFVAGALFENLLRELDSRSSIL